MGYPIEMIDKETKLFALVGENAIESKKEELFNNHFKSEDINAKMMPLNIRMDDIGFFIYGFKDSQIKAGYFQQEYWERLYDLLDNMSEEAKRCGIIDTIEVVNKQNIASLSQGKAATNLLQPRNKRIAIIGNSPSIKSILIHLAKEEPKEIVFYNHIIENCIELISFIPQNLKYDVERIQENQKLEGFDIIIDGNIDNHITYHDNKTAILQLTYHDNGYLNYLDIEKEIAKIKTKEWINNG
jgi:shikimate 5-dehydrogenase